MKKIMKAAALSVSLVALASSAFAVGADQHLNIYGASAEFTFWTAFAPTYLTNSAGCTATDSKVDASGKLGITIGSNCSSNTGGRVILRYTSKNSIEGVRAAAGLAATDGLNTCTAAGERQQAAEPWVETPVGSGVFKASTACQKVDVGASDVSSDSFVQASHGLNNGAIGTTSLDIDLTDAAQGPPAGTSFVETPRQPIIVPFSFFVNNNLSTTTVPNLTRQQILLLMSGNIYNWKMFGKHYPDKQVTVCHRHAGSGTLATLDQAIMRGDRALSQWALPAAYDTAAPSAKVLFHDGSAGLMGCVNTNGSVDATIDTNSIAIGYADSDANVSAVDAAGNETAKYANVHRIKFNGGGEGLTPANKTDYGYSAVKYEIKYGAYEFWSAQWMYLRNVANTAADATVRDLYRSLMSYAATTDLSTCTATSKLGCYWLNQKDLVHTSAPEADFTLQKNYDDVVPSY